MQHIEDELRKAGVVTPTISSDGSPRGRWVETMGYKTDKYVRTEQDVLPSQFLLLFVN